MASEKVLELTDGNWQKEVVESDIPVLVDFSASWCQPCQTEFPVFQRVSVAFGRRIGFVGIDHARPRS